jgi:hypothetical protein
LDKIYRNDPSARNTSMDLAIETRPVERLIPFVRNARTHSEDQIAQIAASIAEFAFVNPVLIGVDDVIVAGHGRALSAKALGLTEVPAIALNHLSEAQRRALVIADNRINENAGWDEAMLRAELAALREEELNLDALGFSDADLLLILDSIDGGSSLGGKGAALVFEGANMSRIVRFCFFARPQRRRDVRARPRVGSSGRFGAAGDARLCSTQARTALRTTLRSAPPLPVSAPRRARAAGPASC